MKRAVSTWMLGMMLSIAVSGVTWAETKEMDADQRYHAALALHQTEPDQVEQIFQAYLSAAQAGSADAAYMVAQSYYQGSLGQAKDPKKAQIYIDQAIQLGSAYAKILQAEIWLKEQTLASRQKAIAILEPLEQQNIYPARHLLAMMYLDATQNQEDELKKGLKLLQQNQRAGYIPSVEAVAWMFEHGHLVEQNLPLAQQLYQVLVQHQIPNMQENLQRVTQKIKQQAHGTN